MMAVHMTAEDARSFGGESKANALRLMLAARDRGCTCKPYEDWFTFGRWIAQGFAVRKGEHGVKLPVVIQGQAEATETEPAKTYTMLRRTTVFCRCQVQPLTKKES